MAKPIVCLICGVTAKTAGRGLCARCYRRLRGKPELQKYPRFEKTLAQLMSEIDTSDPEACWIWPGGIGANGYGKAGPTSAHRAVYAARVAPVAAAITVDHKCCWQAGCTGGIACPHRACVNWVNHLEAVPNTLNQLRSPNTLAGRSSRRTHCPQGHPYDTANTYHCGGRRHCRACKTARDRVRRERRRLLRAAQQD